MMGQIASWQNPNDRSEIELINFMNVPAPYSSSTPIESKEIKGMIEKDIETIVAVFSKVFVRFSLFKILYLRKKPTPKEI